MLNASGHKINQEGHVLYVMSGLGSNYNPVMVNVSSKIDPVSIGDVSALLVSFEARLGNIVAAVKFSTGGSNPSVNFVGQQNNYNNGKIGRGRGRSNGSNRGGRDPRGGFHGQFGRGRSGSIDGFIGYQICYKINHTTEKCYHRADLSYTTSSQNHTNTQSQGGNRSFNPAANIASYNNNG